MRTWPCAAAATLAGSVAIRGGSAALPDPSAAMLDGSSLCTSAVEIAPMPAGLDQVVDRQVQLWADKAQALADALAAETGETPWLVDAYEALFYRSGRVQLTFYRDQQKTCGAALISPPLWRAIQYRLKPP